MKSFTDNLGRTWTLVVNVAAIKRVRALCGVDLNAIVEIDKDNNPTAELLERLSSDPVLLVDVLYAVCKPECDQKGVSDEDFGAAMAGDTVEQATDALLDEATDFSPAAKCAAFRRILSTSRRFGEAFAEAAERKSAGDAAVLSRSGICLPGTHLSRLPPSTVRRILFPRPGHTGCRKGALL